MITSNKSTDNQLLIKIDDDELEWLGFDKMPSNLHNPLLNYNIDSEKDPVEELIQVFTHPDYLHFACRIILNLDLHVLQLVILDVLWKRKLPLFIGSRGSSKSFLLGVYCLLRMIFHPGCKIVIVGNGLRQSRQVFGYMAEIWNNAPVLRDIAGKSKTVGPRREVDRFQFEIGNSFCVAIPIGDGNTIRGLRANYIISDEFHSINEEVFNIVVSGFGIVAPDPALRMREAAQINRMKRLGLWSEEMEGIRKESTIGNQILRSGTAFYAFNHFYRTFKKWHDIISSKGDPDIIKELIGDDDIIKKGFRYEDFAIIRLPYTHVPEGLLDPAILAQNKASLTKSQFLFEYCATFPIDSDGFFKRSLLESVTTSKPVLAPSGQYIQFSASKKGNKSKSHVIGVDPAADRDNASIIVLEMNADHRKIVYCWTTNKKKYNEMKRKIGADNIEDDYYRYLSKKIRSLMNIFNTERIIMDKHGGGTAVAEALASKNNCDEGELPVFTIIDPENPQPQDAANGLHILELLAPTQEINSEANHGMKKDFEDRILLFPMFDVIELARSIEIDSLNAVEYDTYEDLLYEIEELKNEITSIVVFPSSILGRDTFDTPQVKGEGGKKGRLRKDRYSALLYANYYARNKGKQDVFKIDYKPMGSSREILKAKIISGPSDAMYTGPGLIGVSENNWNNTSTAVRFVKHSKN